jgi:hypothetical protein
MKRHALSLNNSLMPFRSKAHKGKKVSANLYLPLDLHFRIPHI